MPPVDGTGNEVSGTDLNSESTEVSGTPPSSETADLGNEDSVQWGSLAEELTRDEAIEVEGDLEVDSASPPAAAPPAPQQPAGNAPTQAATPTGAPAAPAAPAASPAAAAPVAAAPGQPAPSAPVASEEGVAPPPAASPTQAPAQPAFDYSKWRTEQVTQLQEQYKISDDDASALLTEPEVVLPKLLAEHHVRVMEQVLTSVQQMVPRVLEQHTYAVTREQAAKQQFLAVNSDLADPRFERAIATFGQTFRSLNPNATGEEAARAVGNLVRAAYGMTPPNPGVGQPPAATPPAQMPTQPFAPVRGGGGGPAPAAPPQNPFEALALDFLIEDRDS